MSAGGGSGGGFGGVGALRGSLLIDVLGGLVPLIVPLTVVGAGDETRGVGAAALMVTVTGHVWTTGPVSVTGLTLATSGSGTTTRFDASGFDNRTANHEGELLLVTPFRIDTGAAAGAVGGLVSYSLTFVPEPGPLVALGSAIAALLTLGLRRRSD